MKSLGHVRVCGIALPVRVGSADEEPLLKGAYGAYNEDKSTVWLNEDNPPYTMAFWAAHEALHALVNLSGAMEAAGAILGMKDDDPRLAALEENIIRVITPHLIETFGPARVRK